MKSEGIGKHVVFAFIIALFLYLSGFGLIEHFRQVKGPWRVTFKSDGDGHPSVVASQQKLNLASVTFVFPDVRIEQANLSRMIIFDSPITNIPFGKVLFLDTTFLPGTVTMDLFGHEIELLPRVLVLNRKEIPWKSGTVFELSEKEKPPSRHQVNGAKDARRSR